MNYSWILNNFWPWTYFFFISCIFLKISEMRWNVDKYFTLYEFNSVLFIKRNIYFLKSEIILEQNYFSFVINFKSIIQFEIRLIERKISNNFYRSFLLTLAINVKLDGSFSSIRIHSYVSKVQTIEASIKHVLLYRWNI